MKNEIILFTDGNINIGVQIKPEQETVWLLGYAYYKRGSIDRKQFVQRNIKTEFSKFEKYKDAIPHGGCVL